MADLVFGRPRYAGGPAHLVFGATSGVVVPDPVQVTITVLMEDVQVTALVTYDNKNPRRASTSAVMPHQVASRVQLERRAPHAQAARGELTTGEHWQQAAPASAAHGVPWGLTTRADAAAAAAWEIGDPISRAWRLAHERALTRQGMAAAAWEAGAQTGRTWALAHERADMLRQAALAGWQVAAPRRVDRRAFYGAGLRMPAALLVPWQVARPVPPGREVWPPVDPSVRPPREINTHLVFSCPPWLGGSVHLVFGRVCGAPQPPATVVVPVRSVYMIVNNASLRRVSNNQSLPTYSTSLTIDSDSWTWGFSASMPADALGMIQRVDPAEPVEVELTINGNVYRALIESAVRSRTFKDWTLSVRGRGLGAVLDTPYAPQQVFLNTSAMTAQQLMVDAMTINGQSIGWAIDWGIDDWLVPGGAWSHQGSMMSAVNTIAAAAGAYIQPHPTSQILRVLPKYPSVPWDWASTVTPDFQLPADVMSVEGIGWVDRPAYNRVYVSGVQHGNVAEVTRLGTAGDLLAPMVADALVTAPEASRQRGLYELAKGGRWAEMNLKMPVLDGVGVIHPGKFVRYNDGVIDRLGIVRSTNVQDDGTEIWQTIGVESYVA